MTLRALAVLTLPLMTLAVLHAGGVRSESGAVASVRPLVAAAAAASSTTQMGILSVASEPEGQRSDTLVDFARRHPVLPAPAEPGMLTLAGLALIALPLLRKLS